MRKKQWLVFLLSGMPMLAVVLGLYGCPQTRPGLLDEIGLRPGNSGFTNLLLGEERLVALKMGNLSETAATDAQDRLNILAEFLQTYAEFFGVPPAKAKDVMVLAAAPEQQAIIGANEMHQTLMVNQEFDGAIVLDGQVFGEYVRVADRNWQLRRVQGRLFDPASLVAPVPSNDDTLSITFRRAARTTLLETNHEDLPCCSIGAWRHRPLRLPEAIAHSGGHSLR